MVKVQYRDQPTSDSLLAARRLIRLKTTVAPTSTSAIETLDRFWSMTESIGRSSAPASMSATTCPIPYSFLPMGDFGSSQLAMLFRNIMLFPFCLLSEAAQRLHFGISTLRTSCKTEMIRPVGQLGVLTEILLRSDKESSYPARSLYNRNNTHSSAGSVAQRIRKLTEGQACAYLDVSHVIATGRIFQVHRITACVEVLMQCLWISWTPSSGSLERNRPVWGL